MAALSRTLHSRVPVTCICAHVTRPVLSVLPSALQTPRLCSHPCTPLAQKSSAGSSLGDARRSSGLCSASLPQTRSPRQRHLWPATRRLTPFPPLPSRGMVRRGVPLLSVTSQGHRLMLRTLSVLSTLVSSALKKSEWQEVGI